MNIDRIHHISSRPDGCGETTREITLSAGDITELEDRLGCSVTPLPSRVDDGHPNVHLVGRSGGRNQLFIKAFEKKDLYLRETAVCGLLDGKGISTPRLVDHSVLVSGQSYAVYEYHELHPVDRHPYRDREMAACLASLHRATYGLAHGRIPVCKDLIAEYMAAVYHADSVSDSIGDLMKSTLHRLSDSGRLRPPSAEVTCLLHGDYSHRNVGFSRDVLHVFDFERALIGNPFLDFALLWDFVLDTQESRETFLDTYLDETGFSRSGYSESLPAVRLWAAGKVIVFALDHNLIPFLRDGISILRDLAQNDEGAG